MKAYLVIEMPKNCNKCPLHFYEGQGICSCRALPAIGDDEILKPWKNKRKDCPLIPVLPHGDLIDRDEMKETIKPLSPEDEMTGCTFDTVKKLMHTMISRAPVVIPAEGCE